MEVLIALMFGAAACFTVLTLILKVLAEHETSESAFDRYQDWLPEAYRSEQVERAMRTNRGRRPTSRPSRQPGR